jgi:hypothetical protein
MAPRAFICAPHPPVPTALRMRNFETLVPHDSLTSSGGRGVSGAAAACRAQQKNAKTHPT